MIRLAVVAAGMLIAAAPAPAPAADGVLTLHVTNVRNGKGRIHVDLCPERLFLKDGCPYSTSVPAVAGETVVTLRGVPAGTYGAQVFHDENSNNKVDRALFGIPKEGVGFSNDAPIRLSPPKWADARFPFDGRSGAISMKIRYFMGASGPAKR